MSTAVPVWISDYGYQRLQSELRTLRALIDGDATDLDEDDENLIAIQRARQPFWALG